MSKSTLKKGEVELLKPGGGFPWIKALSALFIMTSLGLFVGHAIWTARQRTALDAVIAQIQAAGEPILITDYKPASVSPDQDIVPLIRAAAAAIVKDAPRERVMTELAFGDLEHEAALAPEVVATLREEVAANAPALTAIAGADARTAADWGVTLKSPLMSMELPELRETRAIASLLAVQARLAHHDGQADVVVEALLDIDAIGASLERHFALLSSLVGMAMLSESADCAILVAPDLDLSNASVAGRVRTALLPRLLDDAIVARAMADGLTDERIFVHDSAEAALGGTLPAKPLNGFVRYALRPIFFAGERNTLEACSEGIKIGASAADLATFKANSGRLNALVAQQRTGPLGAVANVFVGSIDPRSIALDRYRTITDRHLAAVTLAAQLYGVDNGGTLPPTLHALVPTYLPAVPIDAIDGKPLRYDAARAIVWSVGENGIDDGGDDSSRSAVSADGNRRLMKDAVIHLKRRPKATTGPVTGPASLPATIPAVR